MDQTTQESQPTSKKTDKPASNGNSPVISHNKDNTQETDVENINITLPQPNDKPNEFSAEEAEYISAADQAETPHEGMSALAENKEAELEQQGEELAEQTGVLNKSIRMAKAFAIGAVPAGVLAAGLGGLAYVTGHYNDKVLGYASAAFVGAVTAPLADKKHTVKSVLVKGAAGAAIGLVSGGALNQIAHHVSPLSGIVQGLDDPLIGPAVKAVEKATGKFRKK